MIASACVHSAIVRVEVNTSISRSLFASSSFQIYQATVRRSAGRLPIACFAKSMKQHASKYERLGSPILSKMPDELSGRHLSSDFRSRTKEGLKLGLGQGLDTIQPL